MLSGLSKGKLKIELFYDDLNQINKQNNDSVCYYNRLWLSFSKFT